jgi:hypothetical protein
VIVRNPLDQPLSFVGLELVVIACGALTFAHAWQSWKRSRDLLPLFTWIAIACYGVAIEITSYETVDAFAHGPFTVMLYQGKLPLYVVFVYPTLLYTGIAAVRRFGLSRWAEPLVAGLAIVLLDVPFDVLGPDAGWWSWSSTDPNLHARWEGVPLADYYWHLAFGACMARLTRSADRWLSPPRARPGALLAAPIAGVATIVLGALSFVPFHLLQRVGVSDGANLALLVSASVAIALFARRGAARAPDKLLFSIVLGYHAFFVVVLAARSLTASVADGPAKAAVLVVSTAVSIAFQAYAQHRGSTALTPTKSGASSPTATSFE